MINILMKNKLDVLCENQRAWQNKMTNFERSFTWDVVRQYRDFGEKTNLSLQQRTMINRIVEKYSD